MSNVDILSDGGLCDQTVIKLGSVSYAPSHETHSRIEEVCALGSMEAALRYTGY